jgi:hypothetical protein
MAQAVSRQPVKGKSGFLSQSVHVEFVVVKVALGYILLRVLWIFPVSVIPPWLHTVRGRSSET